jgi:hypothetical protein
MNGRRRIKRWLALGLALAAFGATAAQAADRPDNRAGPLGIGTQQVGTAASAQGIRPDNRGGLLGVGTQVATDQSDAVSRYLGHSQASSAQGIRPDNRGGLFGVGTQVGVDQSDVVSRYLNHPTAVRPDDRGGIRGVGTGIVGLTTPAPAQSGGSNWSAAELAAASALGALAVALAGFTLIRHRRSAPAALQS